MTALRLHRRLHAIWSAPAGWRGVLTSVNHTDIGRRFIVASFVFFAIGGVLAMLIRAQLATPHSTFIGPEVYSQLFTMHGTLMMFLFAIPLIEGLALYLLPKILGARDLAFPRLSAFGFWCYAFGGAILLFSLLTGLAPDGGWFMYTPLASRTYTPGINADFWLIGVTFVEVSAICAAVEIMVTVLKVRAPGMSLDKMPILAWYLLVTALMMLVGFPPLILGSILLEVERAFDWPFFDPARGGDPLLWQHLFWLFGHPEVYIIFLPAAGVISTVLPVMARTKLMGYGFIVAAILALAFLSFGLWVHHMFAVGIPHMALGFFSAASALVAVPTGVQIFAWLGTLWSGRPELKLPMLYVLGFFFVFVLGGLTGVMLAMVPFNWQAHDTHFVVAHLHYVLVGGFVFPLLAAAYYWLPHFTGHRASLKLGEMAFWLIFIGFNLTFFLMHLTGLLGMPRRVETYSPEAGWTWLNLISSIGGFVLAIGFAVFVIDVAVQCLHGRKAARNPWGSGTLEWAMPLPPPAYNFASLPRIEERDPLAGLDRTRLALARGEGFLGRAQRVRETLGVETLGGRVEQLIELPGNSWLPVMTALVTGAFFIAVLIKQYWAAPLAAVAVALLACAWAWRLGARIDRGAVDIGCGASAPPHRETHEAPGHWGSLFTLIADATLGASLLFGYAYLWTIAPNWPPPQWIDARWSELAIGVGAFALAAAATSRTARARHDRALTVAVALSMVGVVAGAVMLALALVRLPAPSLHAYAAAGAMLACYALVHAGIALIMQGYTGARRAAGYVSRARNLEPRVAAHWTLYACGVGAIALALLHGPVLLGVSR